MADLVRVGVVGANAVRSWAKDSHLPAIAALPQLKLTAVSTRSADSARASAVAFGAENWFDDAIAMCASPHVDLISVCVRVPEHAEIVRAALAHRKHIYCEWPLGRNQEEAASLASAAEIVGVHHAIGLQARQAPAVRRAQELVQSGTLGRLLTARIVSTTSGYAASIPGAYAYLNDPANGANLTTILGGHTLDLAEALLGKIDEVDARGSIQHPIVHLSDVGQSIRRTTPDQLFVLSKHATGCILSTEIGGNRPPDTPFSFEIIGEKGNLRLVGGHPHGFQAGTLRLESSVVFPDPEPELVSGGLKGAAGNVGEVYQRLVADIQSGAVTAPDFAHARRLTGVLELVTLAAVSGMRQKIRLD